MAAPFLKSLHPLIKIKFYFLQYLYQCDLNKSKSTGSRMVYIFTFPA